MADEFVELQKRLGGIKQPQLAQLPPKSRHRDLESGRAGFMNADMN
jgi:hypothetical protein